MPKVYIVKDPGQKDIPFDISLLPSNEYQIVEAHSVWNAVMKYHLSNNDDKLFIDMDLVDLERLRTSQDELNKIYQVIDASNIPLFSLTEIDPPHSPVVYIKNTDTSLNKLMSSGDYENIAVFPSNSNKSMSFMIYLIVVVLAVGICWWYFVKRRKG